MRHLILIVGLCCAQFFTAFAQEKEQEEEYIQIGEEETKRRDEVKTISEVNSNGVYLGITADYGTIEDESAIFGGAKVVYVANRTFEIGVGGKALYSEQQNALFQDGDYHLLGGYGGFHFAVNVKPKEKVHISFPILIGGGAVGYTDEDLFDQTTDPEDDIEDFEPMLSGEAGAEIVFNVTPHFQIEAGGSYLVTSDLEIDRLEEFNLNGFQGGIGFRVGLF